MTTSIRIAVTVATLRRAGCRRSTSSRFTRTRVPRPRGRGAVKIEHGEVLECCLQHAHRQSTRSASADPADRYYKFLHMLFTPSGLT